MNQVESRSAQPTNFKQFELSGWEQSVQAYDASFSRLTAETIRPMFLRLGVRSGLRLLDVASGPGRLSFEASEAGATVVGIDFSPTMIELARCRYPGLDFRSGDAEALDFPDGSFDLVAMNFGLLHLGNPNAALSEARRVLVPGGKLAFTVWAAPTEARGFEVVLRAIEKYGDKSVMLPAGPSFFKYSDERVSREALEAAGFSTTDSVKLALVWELSSPQEFFEAFLRGTARTGGLLRAQPAEALKAIEEEVVRTIADEFGQPSGQLQVPMPVMLYFGRN